MVTWWWGGEGRRVGVSGCAWLEVVVGVVGYEVVAGCEMLHLRFVGWARDLG